MKPTKYRKAVFVVAYAKTTKGIKYLLLQRQLHWSGWEFPKGKIEAFERKKKAVARELKEETGLDIIKTTIHDHKIRGKYEYKPLLEDRPQYRGQSFQLFSVQVPDKKPKVDNHEHISFLWLDFKPALKKLTWTNQKKAIKIVDSFLKKK